MSDDPIKRVFDQVKEAENMTRDIMATIDERQSTHGDFDEVSLVAQNIKHLMRHYKVLPATHAESLDLIATKIARIVCGNPNEPDHWRDIEGYARLVRERLEGE